MFMVDMLAWWYTRGWGAFVSGFKSKLRDIADFFSIGQLVRTLFKPFRQISAGSNENGMSAFFDKLISRIVGFFARTAIIIAGALVILLTTVAGGVMIVAWPFLPLVIVGGVVMTIAGARL